VAVDVSGQLDAPAALPPEKEPRYSLDRKLGGDENPFPCRESNPGRAARSSVTIVAKIVTNIFYRKPRIYRTTDISLGKAVDPESLSIITCISKRL
jgi:hypothetical protein